MLEGMKVRFWAVTCVLLLSVTACSGGDEKETPAKDPAKGTPAAVTAINPLTGLELPSAPKNPVFVVKVDNTPPSAPQQNVDQADMVIEETVEGGVTRLAALYYSTLPDVVAHIRSMRATDIGIAKPVNGQIVASGGAGRTIGRIKDAGITMHTEDGGDKGLNRDSGYAPYNVTADLPLINKSAKQVAPERPYFQWAAADAAAPTGPTADELSVKFSRTHTTDWSFDGKAWKRTNGTSDKEFAAKNLVVLWADEKDAGYTDPAGNPVPETVFEGSGKASIFVGNVRVDGSWSKASRQATIRLTTADGQQFSLPRGATWIELLSKSEAGGITAK